MKKKILCILIVVSFSSNAEDTSWKLYKDSAISKYWFPVLDMKYFGKSIQREECLRLSKFYNKINSQRNFRCLKTNSDKEIVDI